MRVQKKGGSGSAVRRGSSFGANSQESDFALRGYPLKGGKEEGGRNFWKKGKVGGAAKKMPKREAAEEMGREKTMA